jgi:hypothetical protein
MFSILSFVILVSSYIFRTISFFKHFSSDFVQTGHISHYGPQEKAVVCIRGALIA